MKLEIYDDKKEQVDTKEPVKLALRQFGNSIAVFVVDEFGNSANNGALFEFCPNGTVCCCENVNPELGFQLDENGEIVVESYNGE